MSRRRALAGLVVVAVLGMGIAVAPGTIAGTQSGVTEQVDSCQTIDQPVTYTLTAAIANDTTDACFESNASDVPLDGNGYTVDGVDSGVDSAGVLIDGTGDGSVGPVTVESDGATTTGTADGSDDPTDTADGETSTSPGTSTTEQSSDGSGPGFGAVAAVLALLATALLARRRRCSRSVIVCL